MAKREPLKLGKWKIGKECGGRWFPRAGYGYWDGIRYFLKKPINLRPRKFSDGFAIGPLMMWDSTKERVLRPWAMDYCKEDIQATMELYRRNNA